jgi:hypothetical protein
MSNYIKDAPIPEWVKLENWTYCCLCDGIAYRFTQCCGHVTCSGLGCDKCHDLHIEIHRLIMQGKCPRYEDLPKTSTEKDLEELFGPQSE